MQGLNNSSIHSHNHKMEHHKNAKTGDCKISQSSE